MKTAFEKGVPRGEVLQEELTDEMLATRPRDVMEQAPYAVCGAPKRSFESAHPTESLRDLIREVLGRVSGRAPSRSSSLRQETPFGGAQTQNLIFLQHLVRSQAKGLPTGEHSKESDIMARLAGAAQ